MLLAREQRIAAAILLGLALLVWFAMALWPSSEESAKANAKANAKTPWPQRRDSIRVADSLRFEQWKADREARYDSFFIADSIRHAQWRAERQARWDSMRIADSLWRDSVGFPSYTPRIKKDTILDLNHCDTTQLLLIRGIGRATALQIVDYRNRLGGFYSPVQLTDSPFVSRSLDTLLHHFTADTAAIHPLRLNYCSAQQLARHPYLRYEQAKAIYDLRRRRLHLSSISDLTSLPQLTPADLQRLAPYLSFE